MNGSSEGISRKDNRVKVVLGAQWGDEGKGKLVDLLAENANVVARCQGGNNAGHTVVVEGKSYDFHLLPSGIVWPTCISVIGNGVVVHVGDLLAEIQKNEAKGLSGWSDRLKISDRAHLVFDFHQAADGMQETERSDDKKKDCSLGTTKKGIGPTYSSKANRNGVRVSDLVGDFEAFTDKYRALAACFKARHAALESFDEDAELAKLKAAAEVIRPMVTETVSYLHGALAAGKAVLVEGANAAMLDIDFGTYPFVTSSNCSVGGVCTGLGIPPGLVGDTYGVVKAYTTRVGAGPFLTEQINEIGDTLQKVGHEYGVTTGRPRRCGWLDIPLLRYTSMVNGYTAVAVTKLDILDDFDEIKIGIKYVVEATGQEVSHFPSSIQAFDGISVEYITMKGWKTPISGCKTFDELPAEAQDYIHKIEELLGIPVGWIGVGQARDAVITRKI